MVKEGTSIGEDEIIVRLANMSGRVMDLRCVAVVGK